MASVGRCLIATGILIVLAFGNAQSAMADDGADCGPEGCAVRATAQKDRAAAPIKSGKQIQQSEAAISKHLKSQRLANTSKTRTSKGPSVAELSRERDKKFQKAVDAYEKQVRAELVCERDTTRTTKCAVPVKGDVLTAPVFVDGVLIPQDTPAKAATPQPVKLTPQQIAYVAFARLNLTPPTPGIGPAPSRNRFQMAAVGYPLWLWGAGVTDPAPVADSVAGLSVSLEARVSKIVFDMGDGTKVTCQGVGKKWGAWVPAGEKSPTCGHVYQKPSLPEGSYTVTASTHWDVTWKVGADTGVIPLVQQARTTLPVGELQVLVR